jgi:hypothetical protein
MFCRWSRSFHLDWFDVRKGQSGDARDWVQTHSAAPHQSVIFANRLNSLRWNPTSLAESNDSPRRATDLSSEAMIEMFSQSIGRLTVDQLDTLLVLMLLGAIVMGKVVLILVKRYL